MTLTIGLAPEEQACLEAAACAGAMSVDECVRRLIAEHLPPAAHREAEPKKDTAASCEPTRALPPGDRAAEHGPRAPEVNAEEAEANAASIALLQSWLEEEATDDPEEIRKAQQELDDFKRAINAERDRAGARRVYP